MSLCILYIDLCFNGSDIFWHVVKQSTSFMVYDNWHGPFSMPVVPDG